MDNMLNYIIKGLIESVSNNILTNSERKELLDELNIYIKSLYNKLRLTKNVLFRNEPVEFYKNYLPLTLNSKSNSIRVKSPIDLINEYRKIAILGSAGSGKTTLLKYITLKCIDEDFGIPIYIELRNFNDEKSSFEEFVLNSISESKISKQDLFKTGKFVFIFDGFDEINFVEGRDIVFQIDKFISKYNENCFIISSRNGTNIESLTEFFVFEIQPLNWNDITLYVEKLELSNTTKNVIVRSLKEDNIFYKYLTNPLFLSLYINYSNIYEINDLPRKKSVFFRSILDTLFSQHDSVSKLGYVRAKLSGLNKDELETVSTILAFRALISSTMSFTKDKLYNELELVKKTTKFEFENENLIYDLTITVNILILESGYYRFSHIVFLEYLASLFISRLSIDKKISLYKQFQSNKRIQFSSSFINFLWELDCQSFLKYYFIPKLENKSFTNENSVLMDFLYEFFKEKMQKSNDYLSLMNFEEMLDYLKNQVRINEDDNLDELLRL